MKELLKQALMEYKENHKGDPNVKMDDLEYLIQRNEKDYLCNCYLAVASGELDTYIEYMEDCLDDYVDEELEEKKEEIAYAKEHYDEIVRDVNSKVMSRDSIWLIYSDVVENAVKRCM